MNSIGTIIRRNQYAHLKRLAQLSPAQKAKIEAYEASQRPSKAATEALAAYAQKVFAPRVERVFTPTKDQLFEAFRKRFEMMENQPYRMEKEAFQNLNTLASYFVRDDHFLDAGHLVRQAKGKPLKPSFDKGLLIVGGYGTGKTAVMNTFQKLWVGTPLHFKAYTANEVVERYESCQTATEKALFWKRMTAQRVYFDDVKTERMASHYGKTELFKDIIEKRYAHKVQTFVTCNYAESKPGDVAAALDEFGDRYGGRVLDRLFELFNIVEFRGGSFRRQ